MIPDREYTIKPVLVYRLVDPDGCDVDTEDDHGSYPLDFESHADAFEALLEKMQLPRHGPMTEEEQKRAEANERLWQPMIKMYEQSMLEMMKRQFLPIPEASGKTISFYR